MEQIRADIAGIKAELQRIRIDLDRLIHLFSGDGKNSMLSRIAVNEEQTKQLLETQHEKSRGEWELKVAVGAAILSFIFSMGTIIFDTFWKTSVGDHQSIESIERKRWDR